MIRAARRIVTLLPLLAVLGFAWVPGGDMGFNRFRHRASLLPSGRVLVTGGNVELGHDSRSAQLFQAPSTWLPAASMAEPRFLHTQTTLADGRVLVTGGHPGPLATCEIYDPATDTWTAAASMNRVRVQHSASLLQDGRVIVVGGLPGPQLGMADVEIYNPTTNVWTLAAPLMTGRYDHAALVLPGGKLLIVGGTTGVDQIASTELYDPVGNSWSFSNNLLRRRQLPTLASLPDGKVLVAGGMSYDSYFVPFSAEVFNPLSPNGTTVSFMLQDRNDHASTTLADGRVLVVGGYGLTGPTTGLLSSAEIYDGATNTWSPAGSMSSPRQFHSVTTLPDGRVLVAGGAGLFPYPTAAELWVPGDAVPPVITAPALLTVEQTGPNGAAATIPASALDDVDGPVPVTSDAPAIFPQGDTTVHLSATDHAGNVGTASVTVRVRDTQAPTIQAATASPAALSPAKNQMVPVTIAVQASDAADPAPTSRITGVSSNGGSTADWSITGPLTISLRAVKLTGSQPARTYTIMISCTDRSGNAAQRTLTVTVQR